MECEWDRANGDSHRVRGFHRFRKYRQSLKRHYREKGRREKVGDTDYLLDLYRFGRRKNTFICSPVWLTPITAKSTPVYQERVSRI